MKVRITENERGFLYQEGSFIRMLAPGKYSVWGFRGQQVKKVRPEGRVEAGLPEMAAYLKDETFARETVGLEVADNHLAFWFVDGRLSGYLPAGSYRFWDIYAKNTFQVVDTSLPDTADIPPAYFEVLPESLYLKVAVAEGEAGLLLVDNAYRQTLGSGTYYFWNARRNVSCKKYDLRLQQMDVSGQEMLTADKVSLRLNFLCSYKITDPLRMETELRGASDQIYSAVQLALREYVGRFRLDALLEQKNTMAQEVLETLRKSQDRLFVAFEDAGLKDIILPGEIRDIMNTVLVAEKQAQANVISRREEVASTRSLLNTAKLLEENATLARLKELEALERIFDKVGSISVSGGGSLLSQLRRIAGVEVDVEE